MNDNKNVILTALFGIIVIAFFALIDFFRRDKEITSDKGRKILSDEEDKENLFRAMRNGDTEVNTKQGTIYIQ